MSKKNYSFRLDEQRMIQLVKIGEDDVPPVRASYMVDLAIAEYLERHAQQAKGETKQEGPRRSPVPPPQAQQAEAKVDPPKRGKGRQAEVDQHGPALVVGDALASTSVERAAMVGTGAPGGGMQKFNPLGAAEPWTGK